MSETRWTPGPWEIKSEFVGPLKIVAGDDEFIFGNGKLEVAYVGADTFDQCRANARLISAAPDMYDALEMLIGWEDTIRTYIPNGGLHSALTAARSALAKARGEKP